MNSTPIKNASITTRFRKLAILEINDDSQNNNVIVYYFLLFCCCRVLNGFRCSFQNKSDLEPLLQSRDVIGLEPIQFIYLSNFLQPDEPGIKLLPEALLANFKEIQDVWEEDELIRSLEARPPSPCDVTFINDNVLIDGKSSLIQQTSKRLRVS